MLEALRPQTMNADSEVLRWEAIILHFFFDLEGLVEARWLQSFGESEEFDHHIFFVLLSLFLLFLFLLSSFSGLFSLLFLCEDFLFINFWFFRLLIVLWGFFVVSFFVYSTDHVVPDTIMTQLMGTRCQPYHCY